MNGLDDLRAWTLRRTIQAHIDIYLSADTFNEVGRAFPYLVKKEYLRVAKQGTRDRNALLLTTRQLRTLASDLGVEAAEKRITSVPQSERSEGAWKQERTRAETR